MHRSGVSGPRWRTHNQEAEAWLLDSVLLPADMAVLGKDGHRSLGSLPAASCVPHLEERVPLAGEEAAGAGHTAQSQGEMAGTSQSDPSWTNLHGAPREVVKLVCKVLTTEALTVSSTCSLVQQVESEGPCVPAAELLSRQERMDITPGHGQQSLQGSRLLIFPAPDPTRLFLPWRRGPERQLVEATDDTCPCPPSESSECPAGRQL